MNQDNKRSKILIIDDDVNMMEMLSIVLKKYEPNCIFCGSTKKLITYKDKLVCPKCIENLAKTEDK